MPHRMRFSRDQQAAMIAGAVASGRIPPGKAGRYADEMAAGGARGGRAITDLVSRWGPGHPIGAARPGTVEAARASDEQLWREMYPEHPRAPDPAAADQPHTLTPLSMTGYRQLYPESVTPVDKPPLIPELSGVVTPRFPAHETGPGALPGAGFGPDGQPIGLASAAPRPVRADVQTAPGGLALTTHPAMTAWHTHPHTDGAGGVHEHEHVHRDDASHDAGPGHSHAAPPAPDVWQPELASAGRGRPRGPRPVRGVAASAPVTGPGPDPDQLAARARSIAKLAARHKVAVALAAVAASAGVRVSWPDGRPQG